MTDIDETIEDDPKAVTLPEPPPRDERHWCDPGGRAAFDATEFTCPEDGQQWELVRYGGPATWIRAEEVDGYKAAIDATPSEPQWYDAAGRKVSKPTAAVQATLDAAAAAAKEAQAELEARAAEEAEQTEQDEEQG